MSEGSVGAPVLSVDGFEGPLDWLLDLARAQTIDLAALSIAALIDAFSTALEAALAPGADQPAPLGAWGDWLVMAANLAFLRSRLLLPPDAAEAAAARAEAEALRRHLIGRAQARAAAAWLDRQDQLGRDVFIRGALTRDALAQEALPEGDTVALLRACLLVLKVPGPDTYQPRRPVLWTLGQAIARMTALLTAAPEGGPLERFLPGMTVDQQDYPLRCRAAVASTFLASLELAKEGRATIEQDDEPSIFVRRAPDCGRADGCPPDDVASLLPHAGMNRHKTS